MPLTVKGKKGEKEMEVTTWELENGSAIIWVDDGKTAKFEGSRDSILLLEKEDAQYT